MDDLPADPELDDESLQNGKVGLHKIAKLLGSFRRDLVAEGFDQEETHELCQIWLHEALEDARR